MGRILNQKFKISLVVTSILLFLSIIISLSYAYFMFNTTQEYNNIASSGCFKLTYTDRNDINLLSAIPLSETDANELTPYEFTIKNVCNHAASYYVNIETLDGSTLSENFLRYKLDEEESYILGTINNNETLINNNAISSRTIKRAILLPNEIVTYNLRLWIDENASIEAADKIFNSKVVISSSLNKNPYVEIALNPNGGSLENNTISVVEGRALTSLPTPTKKGYVFLGWYKTSSLNEGDGVGVEDIADSTFNNLYAKYTEGTYKLSIDPNEGEYNESPAVQEVNVTYKDTYELFEPRKVGYTFSNWSVEYGEESSVSGNIVTMGNEDSYVKANYNINTYKLRVDPNGGIWNNSSSIQEFEMVYKTTKEIVNPVREGYTFTGWSVSSGVLSSTNYMIEASDATLIANWQANDYKWIVYHNKMNLSGSGYTLADTESGHGNYNTTFKGTLKNYLGFQNPSQSSQTIGVDVKYNEEGTPTNNVLNYNYIRNKYSVTVNPNGGTYSSTTSTTTHSNIFYEATYTINNPSQTGYNFSGWTVTGTGSSISGSTFKMGYENANLLAKWSAKTYTLTLNNQGATSSGTTSVTAIYSTALPSITVPSRTGYTFGGYYTGTNGSGTQYIKADGTSAKNWDLDENKTLYAKWTANTYTVTLDNQSPTTEGTTSVTAAYGSSMPSITIPVKKEYDFGGYYTSTNGTGIQYYTAAGLSARNWDKTVPTTLYAKWTLKVYTINFDANGGSVSPSSITVTSGDSFTMPTGTKDYSVLHFWNNSPPPFGSTLSGYYPGQTYTASERFAKTYYAVWRELYTATMPDNDNLCLTRARTGAKICINKNILANNGNGETACNNLVTQIENTFGVTPHPSLSKDGSFNINISNSAYIYVNTTDANPSRYRIRVYGATSTNKCEIRYGFTPTCPA